MYLQFLFQLYLLKKKKNIWNILKALRSHDDTLVDEAVFREKIKIAVADYVGDDNLNNTDKNYEPSLFDSFTLSELANTMYNAIPTKLGDKGYWQSFSAKTAKIVEKLRRDYNKLPEKELNEKIQEELTNQRNRIESRNNSKLTQTINLQQRRQEYKIGKR